MIERYKNKAVPFYLIKESAVEKEKYIRLFERRHELTIPPNLRTKFLTLTLRQLGEAIAMFSSLNQLQVRTIQSEEFNLVEYWKERTRLLEIENQRLRELLLENQNS